MELTSAVCELLKKTAVTFHGAVRRRFMADTVEAFGLSQRQAEIRLGWARDTVRKSQHELRSGITCVDNFSARGRKPAEFHLPNLLGDIHDIVKENIQTDPTFQTTRLYCRFSAPAVRTPGELFSRVRLSECRRQDRAFWTSGRLGSRNPFHPLGRLHGPLPISHVGNQNRQRHSEDKTDHHCPAECCHFSYKCLKQQFLRSFFSCIDGTVQKKPWLGNTWRSSHGPHTNPKRKRGQDFASLALRVGVEQLLPCLEPCRIDLGTPDIRAERDARRKSEVTAPED